MAIAMLEGSLYFIIIGLVGIMGSWFTYKIDQMTNPKS